MVQSTNQANQFYLKQGRLQDVLALIQILAFRGDSSHWTEDSLMKEIRKAKPTSADSWIQIGRDHPEFFRVREPESMQEEVEVALLMRYGVAHEKNDRGARVRPKLAVESTSILFELAKKLNDNQWSDHAQRRENKVKWVIAAFAALASFAGAVAGGWLKRDAPIAQIEAKPAIESSQRQ